MQWLAFWVGVALRISCIGLRVVVHHSFKNSLYMISGSLYNPACNVPLFPQDTPG